MEDGHTFNDMKPSCHSAKTLDKTNNYILMYYSICISFLEFCIWKNGDSGYYIHFSFGAVIWCYAKEADFKLVIVFEYVQ